MLRRKRHDHYYFKVARDRMDKFNDRFPDGQLKVVLCIDRNINGPAQNNHFSASIISEETGVGYEETVKAMVQLNAAGEINMFGDPARGSVDISLPKKYWLPLKTRKQDRYLKIPDWVLLNMRFFSTEEFAIIMYALWRTKAFPVEKKAMSFRFIMRGLNMSHGFCQRRVQKLKKVGALRLSGRGDRGTQLLEVPELAPEQMPRKPDINTRLRFFSSDTGTVQYPTRVQSELDPKDNKNNFNDHTSGENPPVPPSLPGNELPSRQRPYRNRLGLRHLNLQKYPELIIKIRRRHLEHACRVHGTRRVIAAGRLCERYRLPVSPRNIRYVLQHRSKPPDDSADLVEDERVTLAPGRRIRKPDEWEGTTAIFYAVLPPELLALLEYQFPKVSFRPPPTGHTRNHWKRYAPDFDEVEDVTTGLEALVAKFGFSVVRAAVRYFRIYEQNSIPHAHDLMIFLYGEVLPRRGNGVEFADLRLLRDIPPVHNRIRRIEDRIYLNTVLADELGEYLQNHLPGVIMESDTGEIRKPAVEVLPPGPTDIPNERKYQPRVIEVGHFDPEAIKEFRAGLKKQEHGTGVLNGDPGSAGAELILAGLKAMQDDTS